MFKANPTTRRARTFLLGSVAALTLAAAPGFAGDLYVAHGIPGSDLGLPNPLPVDIGLDGGCTALQGVEFGQSAFAATLDAGVYEAQVYLVDGAPCGGTLAVAADIDIPVAGSVIAIAHLDQNGVPTLSTYTANPGDIAAGLAKLQVAHTAAAPAVDVKLKGSGKGAKAKIDDLAPGAQSFAAQLPATSYDVQIKPATGGKPVFELDDVPFTADAYTSVFAVGSPASGSFTLVTVEITP
jgi:hypothetical protein